MIDILHSIAFYSTLSSILLCSIFAIHSTMFDSVIEMIAFFFHPFLFYVNDDCGYDGGDCTGI